VKVCVVEQDIQGSERRGLDNPVARAIQRAVGGRWYVFGPLAYELTSPYRAASLSDEACLAGQEHQVTGAIQPFEFDLAMLYAVESENP